MKIFNYFIRLTVFATVALFATSCVKEAPELMPADPQTKAQATNQITVTQRLLNVHSERWQYPGNFWNIDEETTYEIILRAQYPVTAPVTVRVMIQLTDELIDVDYHSNLHYVTFCPEEDEVTFEYITWRVYRHQGTLLESYTQEIMWADMDPRNNTDGTYTYKVKQAF